MGSNDKLDLGLAKLAVAPAHPGLASLEGDVLQRVRAGRNSTGLTLAASMAALVIGFAGGLVPSADAARAHVEPFGAPSLSPAALLLGAE